MKFELKEKLTLFAENWQAIRKEFIWKSSSTKRLAALLYAIDNRPMDCFAIQDSHALLKRSTGIFSPFRGNMTLCIAAMLSLKENREDIFKQVLSVFEMLKKEQFKSSDYLAIAAYEIAVNAKPEDYQQIVIRTRAFYTRTKLNSFLQTNRDKYIFSALLALSDIDIEHGAKRIEALYQQFKPEFFSKSGVRKLAYILLLLGDSDRAVNQLLVLNNTLKSRKIRLDKEYTLPSLGILASFPVDMNTLLRDIEEVAALLKTQRGFGIFSVTKQELLLFTVGIVASVYAKDIKDDLIAASTTSSVASIIIAQQTAVIVAMVAATTASSSAASSS